MFKIILVLSFLLPVLTVAAQEEPFKIYLIGDAGDNEITGETLDSLGSQLLVNPNSAVVFLGDNSYKDDMWGMVHYGYKGFDSSESTQNKIRAQLSILKAYKGRVYFIPGNHDWWNLTNFKQGRKSLKMEESFIEANLRNNRSIANRDSVFLPKDGTPGPVSIDLNNGKVKLICIDTYWLILLGYKKTPGENHVLEKKFYHQLDSLLSDGTTRRQRIVIAAHHPIYPGTGFRTKEIRYPNIMSRIKQSYLIFPSYDSMAVRMTYYLKKYPGVYFAAGHLHALQYHEADNVHYIVSGAGSKLHQVKDKALVNNPPCNSKTCRIWHEKGFFEIDFLKDSEKVYMYHCDGKKRCEMSEASKCNGGCN